MYIFYKINITALNVENVFIFQKTFNTRKAERIKKRILKIDGRLRKFLQYLITKRKLACKYIRVCRYTKNACLIK